MTEIYEKEIAKTNAELSKETCPCKKYSKTLSLIKTLENEHNKYAGVGSNLYAIFGITHADTIKNKIESSKLEKDEFRKYCKREITIKQALYDEV